MRAIRKPINYTALVAAIAAANSPAQLFAGGQPGVQFEPWDQSTLFQDGALTPVTAPGQPVGLMYDKSKGLAVITEAAKSSEFATAAPWTAVQAAWSPGQFVLTRVTGNTYLAQQLFGVPQGATINVSITVTANNSTTVGGVQVVQGSAANSAAYATENSPSVGFTGVWSLSMTAGQYSPWVTLRVQTNNRALTVASFHVTVSGGFVDGHHAYQLSNPSRAYFARHPMGGVRNLLTYSEFPNGLADAPTRGGLISATTMDGPNGSTGGIAFGHDGMTGSFAYKTAAVLGDHALSVYVRMDDGAGPPVFGNLATPTSGLNDFALVIAGGIAMANTQVEDVGGGLYRVRSWRNIPSGNTFGVVKYATNSSRTFKVTGYQLETGVAATAYQKVTTIYDVTQAGVPDVYGLRTDGIDDGMQTSPIDFGAYDEVVVCAGVRKLSDASIGTILELGTNISNLPGTFLLRAPQNATQSNYGFDSRGANTNVAIASASGFPSPNSAVLSGIGKTTAAICLLRVNGAQVASSTVDQGGGAYGNFPLYLFRRAGATLPFNGYFYGLTVRAGAMDAATLNAVERNIGARMYQPMSLAA